MSRASVSGVPRHGDFRLIVLTIIVPSVPSPSTKADLSLIFFDFSGLAPASDSLYS